MERTRRQQTLLIAGRIVVGGGALLAPRITARAIGIDPTANPAAVYIGRLFGVRAVFMALLLAASRDAERDRQLRAGVAVDVVDALAAVAAGRRRELRPLSAWAAFAAAVTEASLGACVLRRRAPAAVPQLR